MSDQNNLEIQAKHASALSDKTKNSLADIVGNVSCSLVVGGALDYFASHLDCMGILVSRAYATVINALTSTHYGKWRDYVFKKMHTTEESSLAKMYISNVAAFVPFQVPVYATAVGLASYLSDGYIDFDKVKNGAFFLTMISPAVAPTQNWTMDKTRQLFGIKSSAQKVSDA